MKLYSCSLALLLASNAAAQCGLVKLRAEDASGQDWFGFAVAFHEDRVLVGAPYDAPHGPRSGSAYVFVRQGAGWVQEAKLIPDDGDVDNQFGFSVALDGGLALISAQFGDGVQDNTGAAYVFERMGSRWIQVAKLMAPSGGGVGYSVAIYGETALLGAIYDSETDHHAGAAYVFQLQGQTWEYTAKLRASDGGSGDRLGWGVAVYGDTAMVSAAAHSHGGIQGTGAVYVYERNAAGGWDPFETTELIASDAGINTHLGSTLSLCAETLATGAGGPPGGVGAAYLFERDSSGIWGPDEVAKLTASDGEPPDSFSRVALHEDTLFVGDRTDDPHGLDSGSAYVFLKEDCSVWPTTESAKLSPDDGQEGDSFGVVSVWRTVAAIGAPFDDEPYNSGSVYIVSPEVGAPYCFGPDGSCPCNNSAGADEGCANSSGAGAHLCATGSDRVCADDLSLNARELLPNQPALLFAGEMAVNGGSGAPFGDGLRCAGAGIRRLGVRVPNVAGRTLWGADLGASGGWAAGDTRYFQVWYRDPVASPCGSGFNLTNGVEVLFAP